MYIYIIIFKKKIYIKYKIEESNTKQSGKISAFCFSHFILSLTVFLFLSLCFRSAVTQFYLILSIHRRNYTTHTHSYCLTQTAINFINETIVVGTNESRRFIENCGMDVCVYIWSRFIVVYYSLYYYFYSALILLFFGPGELLRE